MMCLGDGIGRSMNFLSVCASPTRCALPITRDLGNGASYPTRKDKCSNFHISAHWSNAARGSEIYQINWSTWAACVVQWKVTWNTLALTVNCITHLCRSHFIEYCYFVLTGERHLKVHSVAVAMACCCIGRAKTKILKYQPGRVGHVGCRSRLSGWKLSLRLEPRIECSFCFHS